MKIIQDSREQCPYSFAGPRYAGVTVEVGTLTTGDYSIAGFEDAIALERKSIDDLVSSLSTGRARFEKELSRARGYDVFAIIAECTMQDVAEHRYRSQMQPHAVLQSLFCFQVRYSVPVIWAGSREGGEYTAFSILQKFITEKTVRLEHALKAHGKREAVS